MIFLGEVEVNNCTDAFFIVIAGQSRNDEIQWYLGNPGEVHKSRHPG